MPRVIRLHNLHFGHIFVAVLLYFTIKFAYVEFSLYLCSRKGFYNPSSLARRKTARTSAKRCATYLIIRVCDLLDPWNVRSFKDVPIISLQASIYMDATYRYMGISHSLKDDKERPFLLFNF